MSSAAKTIGHRLVVIVVLLAVLFASERTAKAQTTVALAPSMHQQFVDSSGNLLSGGFLYTYAAGTTTMQATYADALGTIQNADPIPLDASGSPSNTSGAQVQIWFANQSYRICAFNSSMVQQWCWDNVSSYQILNNLQSLTFQGMTSDPSGLAGTIDYRSDIPCFRGFTTFWDCFVTFTGTQTLTNKTFDIGANSLNNNAGGNIAGHYPRNNGTQYVDSALQSSDLPSVYTIPYANSGIGTAAGLIAKLVGAPAAAQTVSTSDTSGAIGICATGCGTSGNGNITTIGQTSCVFDGGTMSGDYIQISGATAGNCHDAGAVFPASGQVLGRVLTTNASAGTYTVLLFPAEERLSTNIMGSYPNANSTGTTQYLLAKLTGAPATAVVTTTSDTGGAIGICQSGCGNSGNASFTTIGQAICTFDGSTTAGDYVQISSSVTGNCTDGGSTYPSSGQVLGRVLSTNSGAGNYSLLLFGTELRGFTPAVTGQSYSQSTLFDNTTIATFTTNILHKAVTMPASGCPCRALVSYAFVYSVSNQQTVGAWVSDGTHNFANSQAGINAANLLNMGLQGSDISPVTYSNGANITFTVQAETSGGSVTAGPPSYAGTQYLRVLVITSN